MKKKLLICSVGGALIVILGLLYYKQSNISIWGFSVQKSELKSVRIMTKDKNYLVTDSKSVLELSTELSKMKKIRKAEPNNWPPSKEHNSEIIKISVQTKDQINYGGSFWEDGDKLILDGNGYYWSVSKGLSNLMDKSLIDAKVEYEAKGN